MKGIERLNAIMEGRAPDRWPFIPSIYEHGPAVIGQPISKVSRNADLMASAAIESYKLYRHDLVTVGVDIYNIEAEALGCRIEATERSIPGVVTHPLQDAGPSEIESLEIPEPGPENRLGTITEASGKVFEAIGDEVWIYGCMGGPFSQAVELRGFEQLIADIYTAPELVHSLMEKTAELSVQQAERLSRQGCGIYLYESWATIPLIHGEIFEKFVVPYNKRVITRVREQFDTPPPGVIMGGDTAMLIDYFLEAGTCIMVADYNTDFDLIRDKISNRRMLVRGCVDPKLIERGEWDTLEQSVSTLAEKARGMQNFVWGCGCVSFDTPPENLLRFKDLCLAANEG